MYNAPFLHKVQLKFCKKFLIYSEMIEMQTEIIKYSVFNNTKYYCFKNFGLYDLLKKYNFL